MRTRIRLVQQMRTSPNCHVYLHLEKGAPIFDKDSGAYVVVVDDSSHAFAALRTPDPRRAYFVDSTTAFPYELAFDALSLELLLDGHAVGYVYSVRAKSRRRKRRRAAKPPARRTAQTGTSAPSTGAPSTGTPSRSAHSPRSAKRCRRRTPQPPK